MKLKLINWDKKIEEVRKKVELQYDAYLKDKKSHNSLMSNIAKGELIWQIVNGNNSEKDFHSSDNVKKINSAIKLTDEKIKSFEEKYLKTEDMKLYMRGLVTADLAMLERSYRMGNMDAAYIWGLVRLNNGINDKDYSEAIKALEEVAAGKKNTFYADAMIALAEYYKIHGLSEAQSIPQSEDELSKSLKYYENATKLDSNADSYIKNSVDTIRSVLKSYNDRKKTEGKINKINKAQDTKRRFINAIYFSSLSVFSLIFLYFFLLIASHAVNIKYEDDRYVLKVGIADTIVLDKNTIYFSDKLPILRIPSKLPVKMNVVNALDSVLYKREKSKWAGTQEKTRKLKNFIIKDGVEIIPNLGTTKVISSVELPDSVQIIESEAFRHWALTRINLPESITEIGEYAFAYSNISEIDLPKKLTTICNGTFMFCEYLKKVKLPKNLLYIGEETFLNCEKLTEIVLPDSIKEIGANAFTNTGLESIELPYGIEYIDPDNFDTVQQIYVDEREYERYMNYFNSDAEILIKN